jgi:hypothetical protein
MNKLRLLSQNKRIFVCVSEFALVCKQYDSNQWQVMMGDLVLYKHVEDGCIQVLEKLAKHIETDPEKVFKF